MRTHTPNPAATQRTPITVVVGRFDDLCAETVHGAGHARCETTVERNG
jgi:hypothetical protein